MDKNVLDASNDIKISAVIGFTLLCSQVSAQNISPAQCQEFTDSKTEDNNAQLQSRHH
jgi:hypothetical protein